MLIAKRQVWIIVFCMCVRHCVFVFWEFLVILDIIVILRLLIIGGKTPGEADMKRRQKQKAKHRHRKHRPRRGASARSSIVVGL